MNAVPTKTCSEQCLCLCSCTVPGFLLRHQRNNVCSTIGHTGENILTRASLPGESYCRETHLFVGRSTQTIPQSFARTSLFSVSGERNLKKSEICIRDELIITSMDGSFVGWLANCYLAGGKNAKVTTVLVCICCSHVQLLLYVVELLREVFKSQELQHRA